METSSNIVDKEDEKLDIEQPTTVHIQLEDILTEGMRVTILI